MFLSFPDWQSLWAGSAYITLGVASAFGPDHYILPHITQRIQAASAFQAGPHFISYPGAVPTLSHLQRAQVRMETSLNSYLANSSPFKSDIGSLVGKIEGVDTQSARE